MGTFLISRSAVENIHTYIHCLDLWCLDLCCSDLCCSDLQCMYQNGDICPSIKMSLHRSSVVNIHTYLYVQTFWTLFFSWRRKQNWLPILLFISCKTIRFSICAFEHNNFSTDLKIVIQFCINILWSQYLEKLQS